MDQLQRPWIRRPGGFRPEGRRRRSRDLWSKISRGDLPDGGYLFSVRLDSALDGIELIVASGDQALEGKNGEDGSGG